MISEASRQKAEQNYQENNHFDRFLNPRFKLLTEIPK